jgi:hypothetical protein
MGSPIHAGASAIPQQRRPVRECFQNKGTQNRLQRLARVMLVNTRRQSSDQQLFSCCYQEVC